MGNDPVSGKPMVVKDGRFGPYVTDGETNASLRKGDEVATLTLERAAQLLADRRDAAPATRTRRPTAAKSTGAAKKTNTTAKKATGAAAKPAAAKKPARTRKSSET
jgi:DNA topoisomerase-1